MPKLIRRKIMIRVDMSMNSWDSLLFMLAALDTHHIVPAEIDAMYKEISNQIYSKESQ